jgi:hypothetical protein
LDRDKEGEFFIDDERMINEIIMVFSFDEETANRVKKGILHLFNLMGANLEEDNLFKN